MKNLSLIAILVALLTLGACHRATFITPDKAQVEFTLEGGEAPVSVSSDGSWEVNECPEWVTTELQDSSLLVKVAKNDSGKVREGNIVLASGEVTATIAVRQMAKCTHITAEKDTLEFEKDGGSKTVKIDTDGALQVTAPDGFTADYVSGVLTVTTTANDGGKRSGIITLTADEQTASINVSQAGNICPTCNGTGKVKCTKCGGKGSYDEKIPGPPFGVTHGCKKCGGSGEEAWGGAGGAGRSSLRKGSGSMTCPDCNGAGS